jgi:hypothetical protein
MGTAESVVNYTMTKLQYWGTWLTIGVVALVAARYFLVQPIIDAIKGK